MKNNRMVAKPIRDKINEWYKYKEKLDEYKIKERELRDEITEKLFKEAKKGTHYAKLENGYRLKAVKKEYINLDVPEFTNIREKLSSGAEDFAIKWTPDLIASGYKKLSDKDKKLIDSVLIIKEGAPTLTIVPPKE